jgi:nucleoside-diphosphate-sugar epimerase
MEKVIVTGGFGYIGSRLVSALLALGKEVHVVTSGDLSRAINNSVKVHKLPSDVSGIKELFVMIGASEIYNLMGYYLSAHKESDFEVLQDVNLTIPAKILEAGYRAGIKKFIMASSVAEHLDNNLFKPSSLYGAQRRAIYDLSSYYALHDVRFIFLKIFETFGEDDKRNKILNRIILAALNGEELVLSNPKQLLEMVHVDDVVQAFINASEFISNKTQGCIESYRINSMNAVSLGELVSSIESFGYTMRIKWLVDQVGENGSYRELWHGDDTLPNWKPLKSGLNDLKACINSLISLNLK